MKLFFRKTALENISIDFQNTNMITLTKKLKASKGSCPDEIPKKRISVRDQLLVKEVST